MPSRDYEKKKSSRKQGAQPGNKNALKHGFYQARYSNEEIKTLDAQDSYSIESELALIRVYISRISKLVPGTKEISEDDLKAINTLTLMTQAVSTLVRTYYLTRGKGGQIEQGIMEALEELRMEMGL